MIRSYKKSYQHENLYDLNSMQFLITVKRSKLIIRKILFLEGDFVHTVIRDIIFSFYPENVTFGWNCCFFKIKTVVKVFSYGQFRA